MGDRENKIKEKKAKEVKAKAKIERRKKADERRIKERSIKKKENERKIKHPYQDPDKVDDCKNLSKKTCKEVEAVVRTDQKLIDRQSDGKKCELLGRKDIYQATAEYKRMVKFYKTWKVMITKIENSWIHIQSRSLSGLQNQKCSWVFSSVEYLTVHKKMKHAIRSQTVYHARMKAAWKFMLTTKKQVQHARKKCHCAAKKTSISIWRRITNAARIHRQTQAYAKCKLMLCLLNNIPTSRPECKARLPRLRRKTLSDATHRTKCA